MTFAAPGFLLVLAIVPAGALAAALARRRRATHAIRFPAASTLAAVNTRVPAWWRWQVPLALGAAACCLALALARPQTTIAVAVERATAVLVMDASGSMMATDVSPTRLEAARRAARRFVTGAGPRLQIGVVGYSTVPHTILDPTQDRAEIMRILDGLIADGATATGDALRIALSRITARRRLDGASTPAAIVLLSDGATTDGPDPVGVAREAAAAHVPVYTFALGTPDGTVRVGGGPFPQTVAVPPDPVTLGEIARVSGGRAHQVSDAGKLESIYGALGSQVGTRRRRHEVTASFAGAGLLLLLAAAFGGLRRRGVLP